MEIQTVEKVPRKRSERKDPSQYKPRRHIIATISHPETNELLLDHVVFTSAKALQPVVAETLQKIRETLPVDKARYLPKGGYDFTTATINHGLASRYVKYFGSFITFDTDKIFTRKPKSPSPVELTTDETSSQNE